MGALFGKALLKDVSDDVIRIINCLAAGAVIASLATEVFPSAFKRGNHWAGTSTAIGLMMAFGLHQLG